MKKLIIKICILMALIVITEMLLMWLPQSKRNFFGGIEDKRLLLKAVKSPKFVFIGGSNMVSGFDSPYIQGQLGMPVVNMGINAGIGLRYMCEEIKSEIHPGDIIVVVPEYHQFFGSALEGSDVLLQYLDEFPQYYKDIRTMDQRWALLKEVPGYVSKKFQTWTADLVYKDIELSGYQKGFNENGDLKDYMSGPANVARLPLFMDKPSKKDLNENAFKVLKELSDFARERGAQVVLLYPPIPKEQYAKNRELLDWLDEMLKEELDIPVLAKPQDFSYDVRLFYDTVYHLNEQGKQERSLKVFNVLREFLDYQYTKLSG